MAKVAFEITKNGPRIGVYSEALYRERLPYLRTQQPHFFPKPQLELNFPEGGIGMIVNSLADRLNGEKVEVNPLIFTGPEELSRTFPHQEGYLEDHQMAQIRLRDNYSTGKRLREIKDWLISQVSRYNRAFPEKEKA